MRFALLLGAQLLGLLAIEFVDGPALHFGIEHFQGAAAGVDLVVMGEIGEKVFVNWKIEKIDLSLDTGGG